MKITNNIEHTTADYTSLGTFQATITVICESGYTFENAPTMSYTNWDGYTSKATFTLAEENAKATVSLSDIDTNYGVKINGSVISSGGAIPELTVNNNIADTTENHTYDGETATISIVGENTKYTLINPTVNYTNISGESVSTPMTVTTDESGKSTATATVTDIDPEKPVTITGTYTAVILIVTNLSNCSLQEALPEYYAQGETINIALIANDNTAFETAPTIKHLNDEGYNITTKFELSDDKKTATLNYTLPDYVIYTVTITAEAEPITIIGGGYGSINAYVVTLDNLNDFAKVRFFKETTSDGETSSELIDLGKYVNRIKRLYTKVPTSSTDVIKCANWNTNISCLQPSSDKIILDFGAVTLPDLNTNTTDYQSEFKLFIPFAGFLNVPTDYVGEEISLSIEINVITANGTAKISHNDILFQTVEITPSNNVLYRTSTDITTIGEDDWNEKLYWGLEPFLYCKLYRGINNDERNNDNTRGKISSFIGYNEFTDITQINNTVMLADEQQAIYNELQRGVYII